MSPAKQVEVPLTRVFMDLDGTEWQVSEVDGQRVPAARGERCLIFRSNHVVRRVWNYPTSWASLRGEELMALSWKR